MSTDRAVWQDSEDELESALIAYCRLTDDVVVRTREVMRTESLAFGEAAVHCGAVTRHELDEATAWVYQQLNRRRNASVIETAMRRRDQGTALVNRSVIMRHSAEVRPGPQLTLLHHPYAARSERIRALRTELLLLEDRTRDAMVMTMLSPGTGEGRSLLVAELAVAFAQLGRRTLLIDADLRKPHLHQLFNAENSWGLAQTLSLGEPPPLLGVEGVPQLSLLTAGPVAPNPLELLSDGRFERVISEWRRGFDLIMIDTPPVNLYADALAIATIAGHALVVSRAAVTAHRDMKEMLRRLGTTQARIMGAVINHF